MCTSTSSTSGSTATVAVEVWIRPVDSVTGTRWTRWTPDSYLSMPKAPLPFDLEDHFLDPAEGGFGRGEDLGLVAQVLRVAHDHPLQLGSKERGFVAAGSGPYLDDGVLVVARVLLQDREAELLLQSVECLPRRSLLLGQELLHIRIKTALFEHRLRLVHVLPRFHPGRSEPVCFLQIRARLGDLGHARRVGEHGRIRKLRRESGELLFYFFD